jgi:glyoxylase-like metal-dependent hydrolase (beta-lactamase superfamily II)
MERIANGVHQVSRGVNAFIIDGDDGVVLIDTGLPRQQGIVIDALTGIGRATTDVVAILITHGHVDHVGGAAALVEASSGKLYAARADTPMIEGRVPKPPPPVMEDIPFIGRIMSLLPSGAPVRVDHVIGDPDTRLPADIRPVPTPGHTPGHTSYLLDRSDGILFVGDAAVATRSGQIRRGWMNRATPVFDDSVRTMAQLDFAVACFGHAHPITAGAAGAFRAFAADLP